MHNIGQMYKQIYILPIVDRLLIETVEWKIPNLMLAIPQNFQPKSVIEVGCLCGHLIANILINGQRDFQRIGCDINPESIKLGRYLYPHVNFLAEDIFARKRPICKFVTTLCHRKPYMYITTPLVLENNFCKMHILQTSDSCPDMQG